jgi:O-antigen/teichoic acid export membrane protein
LGVVKNQAFYNSIVNYLGIAIGFVNLAILFPKFLGEDLFGLTRVMLAVATFYVQFSALGANKMILKFFPFFRTNDGKNRGFLTLVLLVPFLGFLVMTGLYLGFQDGIMAMNVEKSPLFVDYYYYVIGLAFLLLYFSIFESYLQALYKTVFSNFLKSILQRVLWIIGLFLYSFEILTFDQFLLFFISVNGINIIIMVIMLIRMGKWNFATDSRYYKKRVTKLISTYSAFTILSGISNVVVNRIDVIMISSILGLKDVAVYAVAVAFGTVISSSTDAIGRVSFPIIAANIKAKKFKSVALLYSQTAIIQTLFGGFAFVLIWINADVVLGFIGPQYIPGKYVILYLGLAKMIDVATGVNGLILLSSRYYRYDTYTSLMLVIVTIGTNVIFIPMMGIEGAALATAISLVLYNVVKVLLIQWKMKMQPFSVKTIVAFLVLGAVMAIGIYIPTIEHPFLDVVLRSGIVCTVFMVLVLRLKISPEINETAQKIAVRFGLKASPKKPDSLQ